MKWKAEWWGITIEAESFDEEDTLYELYGLLPTEPYKTYEGGSMREERNKENQLLQLVFER